MKIQLINLRESSKGACVGLKHAFRMMIEDGTASFSKDVFLSELDLMDLKRQLAQTISTLNNYVKEKEEIVEMGYGSILS
jgi:hypothetical protein